MLVRDAKSVTGHVRCQVTGRNPTVSVSRAPVDSIRDCQGLNRNTAISPNAMTATTMRFANGDIRLTSYFLRFDFVELDGFVNPATRASAFS